MCDASNAAAVMDLHEWAHDPALRCGPPVKGALIVRQFCQMPYLEMGSDIDFMTSRCASAPIPCSPVANTRLVALATPECLDNSCPTRS